jgi:choline dehydrogenase-like flavoprotein
VITDARDLPSDVVVRGDLCVIGAGPAGQTVAREFAATDKRVLLLESGNLDFDQYANSLNDGEVVSSNHSSRALKQGRRRGFGGTTNLWVYGSTGDDGRRRARMLIPQPLDFEDRGLGSIAAWPFGRTELEGHYKRAQKLFGIERVSFVPEANDGRPRPLEVRGSRLINVVCHHAARDVFSMDVVEEMRTAPGVEVFLNATVTELIADASGGRVEEVHVARPDGSTVRVVADVFVLATGGIENARLLLLSSDENGGGLRTGGRVTGKYLMDHPEFDIGVLKPAARNSFQELGWYDLRWEKDHLVSGHLAFSEQVLRDESLLNMCFVFIPQRRGYGSHAEQMLKSMAAAGGARKPKALAKATAAALRRPREAAGAVRNRYWQEPYREFKGGWSNDGHLRRFSLFEIFAATEQPPHEGNRVTLSEQRDALGLRRARMQWSWHRSDAEMILRAQRILKGELSRLVPGDYESLLDPSGKSDVRWTGIHHPMGTTRMARSPEYGVVDEDSKVYGISNLYVAGTSVFPSSLGFSNPTFTVVALAIRLADHLRSRL